MKKSLPIVILAFLVGGVAGYVIKPAPEVPAANPAEAKVEKAKSAAEAEEPVRKMRNRIKERRTRSEVQVGEGQEGANESTRADRADRHGPPSFADMRKRMEEFKERDPEHYAQMTNQFAQMRNRQSKRAAKRLNLLASIDTSKMTDDQKQTHEMFQEFIAKQEELSSVMANNHDNLSDEEFQNTIEELRENGRKMRALAEDERNILLSQTADQLSSGGNQYSSQEILETINTILEATDAHGGGGPRGPGGPGPDGMGGPGGPGGPGPGAR